MKKWLEESDFDFIYVFAIIIIAVIIISIVYAFWYDSTHECIETKVIYETRCDTTGGSTYCEQYESEVCAKYAK